MLHREWPNSWSTTRYRFTTAGKERLLAHLHKTPRGLLSMGGLKETKEIGCVFMSDDSTLALCRGLAGATQQKVGKVYEYICCRVILMSARPCRSLQHDSMTVSSRGKTKERLLTLASRARKQEQDNRASYIHAEENNSSANQIAYWLTSAASLV